MCDNIKQAQCMTQLIQCRSTKPLYHEKDLGERLTNEAILDHVKYMYSHPYIKYPIIALLPVSVSLCKKQSVGKTSYENPQF